MQRTIGHLGMVCDKHAIDQFMLSVTSTGDDGAPCESALGTTTYSDEVSKPAADVLESDMTSPGGSFTSVF